MNITIVWAWMLWSSDSVEHERHDGFGMDALVIGCSQTGTLLWLEHGCFGHQVQLKINVMLVWTWMLWSSDAVENGRYCGLGAGEYTKCCCVMPHATTTT